tara:strand:+ start:2023 stop:2442 length:420 start_codon:yes stop_codon:yes gene_type:complete
MTIVVICSVLLAYPVQDYDEAMATCLEIGAEAERTGEPPHVLVALAYMESRLDYDAVSPKGAIGPLQAMPYWFEGGIGKIKAGVVAWKYWRARSLTTRVAIAKYNAGYKPGRRSFRFADRIISLSDELHVLAFGVSSVD